MLKEEHLIPICGMFDFLGFSELSTCSPKKWSKSCENGEEREISGKAEAVLVKYVEIEVHPWAAPAEMLMTGLLTPITLNLSQFSCQNEWYFQSYSK